MNQPIKMNTYEVEYLDPDQKTRVKLVEVDAAWTSQENIKTIIALKLRGVTRIKSVKLVMQ